MTCIVGLVHEGTVYMGGDSCTSMGWDFIRCASSKVVKRGNTLIGCCGDVRLTNILHHHFEPPPHNDGYSDDKYMVRQFTEKLRHLLKDLGYSRVEENHELLPHGDILVGYNGRLYEIGSDFSVVRSDRWYTAIGSGYTFALGALAASTITAPDERVLQSLQVAGDFVSSVCEPYYVLSLPSRESTSDE